MSDVISIETYNQIWTERDIAINQLHELEYEFGEKIEPKSTTDKEKLENITTDVIEFPKGASNVNYVYMTLVKATSTKVSFSNSYGGGVIHIV